MNEVAKTHARNSEPALRVTMPANGHPRDEPAEKIVHQIAAGNPPTYR